MQQLAQKGQFQEIIDFKFFLQINLPWPPRNSISDIKIFSKICKDIRNSQCITAINDTGDESPTCILYLTPAASLPPVSITPVVTSDGGNTGVNKNKNFEKTFCLVTVLI